MRSVQIEPGALFCYAGHNKKGCTPPPEAQPILEGFLRRSPACRRGAPTAGWGMDSHLRRVKPLSTKGADHTVNLILRFIRPHRKLCLITVLLLFVDVGGSLFIPTLVAEMLNAGTSGAAFSAIWHTGIQMALISLLAGVCAILGGYACAALTAQVGKDMRKAIYAKSLKLSVYDFRQFGTASITNRTIADITTIQFALTSTIQMVLPVPVICLLALALTFGLDVWMGLILLAVTAVVLVLAFFIMRSASPLFRRLQKLLDRMSTVLLENLVYRGISFPMQTHSSIGYGPLAAARP